MRQTFSRLLLIAALAVFALASSAVAQNPQAALASLPEADALIYISPQRILNEAAPRVMKPADLAAMRTAFTELKTSAGVDPSSVEYFVIAIRFHKPASDLSFVAPDVLAVIGGDFSSESLLALGQLYLQDQVRVENYGSKSISVIKVDPIAAEAEKNPMLKPFAELGVVPLSANSLAIGSLGYLRSALDAADGTGRISAAALASLFRDPNVLLAASGSPLKSFAKSFGLLGLENTTRESRCDTNFADFYAAVTMTGTNFSLRGAMNADNPDTAKIINGLLAGLMQQGISAFSDKNIQTMLQGVTMTTRENEIVLEADIPEQVVADFIRSAPGAGKAPAAPVSKPRRPVKKKRTRRQP